MLGKISSSNIKNRQAAYEFLRGTGPAITMLKKAASSHKAKWAIIVEAITTIREVKCSRRRALGGRREQQQ
jgi:hypothetical protein